MQLSYCRGNSALRWDPLPSQLIRDKITYLFDKIAYITGNNKNDNNDNGNDSDNDNDSNRFIELT